MKYSIQQSVAGLVVCASLNTLILNSANAQTPDNADNTGALSLRQAYNLTLNNNPELAAYPFYLRQADAEKLQAGIGPQTQLSVQIDDAFGTGGKQDLDNAEFTLSLSQTFELGAKKQSRLDFADALQQQTQLEYHLARLDVLAETSRRFYQLLFIKQQQLLLKEREEKENAALKIIQRRANAGAVSDADASNMALRLANTQQLLQQNSAAKEQARLYLAAMWLSDANFNSLVGDFNTLPPLPSAENLQQQIEQQLDTLPDYRLQLAMQRLVDQKLLLEQAKGRADLTLGLGLRQFENSGDQAFTLSASMPLSFNNPNRGRIAAAEQNRALSLQQSEQQRVQLALTLKRLHQSLRLDLQLSQNIEQQLLPLAQTFLADTQKAYQQGVYSLLQWIDAQHQVFTLQQQLINTRLNIHLQVLELERVLGQPIVSPQD
jgi:cobalt-zinc-cadmium efflux system outer membrane protein